MGALKKKEEKVEKEVAKAEKEVAKVLERPQARKAPVRGGNRAAQALMHQHVATAQFLACLFNPFECPSRMPDKVQMMKTLVLPFRQTATAVATGAGTLRIQVGPSLAAVFTILAGTSTWGSASIAGAPYRSFSASVDLANFVTASRCVGLKVRLEYASAFTTAQGVIYGAMVPPGFPGGGSTSDLSQLPNSATVSVVTVAATGAYEMVYLPQKAAGDYDLGAGALAQPFDPQAFIPYNSFTSGAGASFPFIEVICEGCAANATFMMTIEGCFECDTVASWFVGDETRPSEDAFEVLDDVAPALVASNTGLVAQSSGDMKQALAPQHTIIQQAVAGAPASMSAPTASFLDAAEGVLAKAGPMVWDAVKEYGPDVLDTVVGLLPGGSLATTAAKVGGKLAKWLM